MNEFKKTGFVTVTPAVVQERPTTIPPLSKLDTSDVSQIYRSAFDYGSRHSLRERHVRDLIDKGIVAYVKDSMYKNAVDKLAEAFADFNLEGANPRAVAYLKMRLELISLYGREHWKTLFSRAITSYMKTGNTMLMKIRGGKVKGAIRPLYQNKPYAITAIFLHSPSDLEPAYNTEREIIGWTYRTRSRNQDSIQKSLLLPDALELPRHLAFLNEAPQKSADESKAVFYPLVDLAHIAYTKPEGIPWGVGPMLAAIEDLSLLRVIESTIAMMIKKFSNPMLHHIITPRGGPQSSIQGDINNMYMTYRRMAPEGLLVTGPNHEIKVIGAESNALRMEGYLTHFLNRTAGGLASSPFGLGLTPGTLGSSQAFNDMMKSKILKCQKDFSRDMGFQLFWEILYEGGFDPYTNDDDRVHLTFEDIDVDSIIKKEAHATYLFQNDAITHDELREDLKRDPNVSKAGLKSNMWPDAPPGGKSPGQSSSKQAKNSYELKKTLYNLAPTSQNEIEYFIKCAFRMGYLIEEDSYETISNMIGDPEAICEYVLSLNPSSN